IRQRVPDARFTGIGGEQMRREGCELLYPMEKISAMGLDGLFGKLREIFTIKRDLARRFTSHKPDVFVGIDVPDFNLGLELKLKRVGIPTVHYVSPTVWAWRGYRIHKIRRAVSYMLTLFPFEAEYYRRQGVPVTFVGHPMADRSGKPDSAGARAQLGIGGERIIALLPGSREGEMRRLGGVFLDAAKLLHQRHPDLQFLLPFANGALRGQFECELGGQAGKLPLTLLDGEAHLAMEAADGVILASGTAALEAALLERPMVVVYKVSWLSHFLARPLLNVSVYSMPNHLLPEPSIPELIQGDATPRNIADAMDGYLDDPRRTQALQCQFARIREELQQGASRRAAVAVLAQAGIAH
ncbi:MAG: lipid-A-disaccharide synthase, partial [Pseudomonadota bacterium]|nr:lipid-A-disaccharide synthase [Pseudomonadota bacterium]